MLNLVTCLADFFAGALLCNCLPHLLSGLQGVPFPSPFSKPSGVGDSSPLVNVLWGAFNLLAGLVLLSRNPVTIGLHLQFAILAAGFLMMSIFAALHFGKVHQNRLAK